jgi:polysaccharide biosynthesis transport protein
MQYLRALARSWFVVIITLIAGGAGGYYVYHRATPLYESSVRMVVTGNSSGPVTDEVTARSLAGQRALALSQIAGTAPAIKAAARAAGYPADSPSVTATSPDDGPFVSVRVVDTSAVRAQAIANAYAGILPETLETLEGSTDTTVKVANLAPAGRPAAPFSPKLVNDLALGLAAGFILGIAIALLREVIDRTIRDTDELERITGLTILGTIPRDGMKNQLPAITKPRSARAEAYRQIRTTLLNSKKQPRTLAVTSAAMGEGKTSVATNLAAVFSRAGHRVAIVDADLRRPRVAPVFEVPSKPGLSDVLARRISLQDALVLHEDGRLAILTSGPIPANPSEALGGTGMGQVIQQLAAEYEYVIIDTPPVLPVTDALVVAPMVDGVVLVTRLGRTTRERVKRAQAAVDRVNASMIGVVPNYAGKGADRDYRYGYKYTGSHKGSHKNDATPTDIDADLLQPSAHAAPAHAAGTSPVSPNGTAPVVVPAVEQTPPQPAAPMEPTVPAEPMQTVAPLPPEPAYVPPEPAYVPPAESLAPPLHDYSVPPEPVYVPPAESSDRSQVEPFHLPPMGSTETPAGEPAYVPPETVQSTETTTEFPRVEAAPLEPVQDPYLYPARHEEQEELFLLDVTRQDGSPDGGPEH